MDEISKSAERKLNEGADKVRESVEKVRRQGTDVIDKSFPLADEAIEKAKAKGEAFWNKAKIKGQDLLDEVESGSAQMFSRVKSYVRNRPVQALGYALMTGLVIGAFFSAKSREK